MGMGVLMGMFMWRGRLHPRDLGSGRMLVVMMMTVVVTMMIVFVVRVRGRPRHILFRPVLFPRKIFLSVDPHVHLGRRNPAADDSRNLQPRAHVKRRHGFFQYSRRNSGIDERAQEHVAAHAGKTF